MKARKFNDRHKYTLDSDEHDRNCECGECYAFVDFMKRALYGKAITNRGFVIGGEIPMSTREGK
jgi:hypothetical protein